MRIAVTGSNGQLGGALLSQLANDTLMGVDLPEHDITQLDAIAREMERFAPDIIIHAAAMTDVDGCERNPELAFRVNALGTRNLAIAAQRCDAAMVYISTDYVFDGESDEPYWEYDPVNPLSIYGRTKAFGEQIVRDLLTRFYIVRIAWLYGDGPRNFVKTMIRLACDRDELRVVTDETGSPTYAGDVARALDKLVRTDAYGIYHLPNSGTCSRYEWAAAILEQAGPHRAELVPTTNYPRAARVPKHASLRNACGEAIGITLRPWQEALAGYMRGMDRD